MCCLAGDPEWKMAVLGSVAETFTDMMDTARSARLELLIVVLIIAELIIAAVTMFHPVVI
jgi:uncharacterized Rmd1/YagE family protein